MPLLKDHNCKMIDCTTSSRLLDLEACGVEREPEKCSVAFLSVRKCQRLPNTHDGGMDFPIQPCLPSERVPNRFRPGCSLNPWFCGALHPCRDLIVIVNNGKYHDRSHIPWHWPLMGYAYQSLRSPYGLRDVLRPKVAYLPPKNKMLYSDELWRHENYFELSFSVIFAK